jgi:type II secretory pathway component PulF
VVIAAVVVAVIVVVILAIFLLPKMFHVYRSPGGLAPTPGPRPATAQLR